jgi:CheY-like chemotaxis protein
MVLIVEDEAISRRALQHLLRLHGYEARTAGSAEEAMQQVLATGHRPEMALVDINLPGMNGVEFVRRLHRMFPSVRCVFMTANDAARDERLGSASAEPTLQKPFDVPDLLRMMHREPVETGGDSAYDRFQHRPQFHYRPHDPATWH